MQIYESSHTGRASSDQDHQWRSYPHFFLFFCEMQINNISHADRASSDQDH
jgi:hypothetical protein